MPILPLLAAALAAPPGEPVDLAAAVHISQPGLDALASGLAGLLPEGLEIDDFSGDFACDDNDASPLAFDLTGLDLDLIVDSATLTASEGRLDLDIDLGLIATTTSTRVTGSCTFILTNLDQQCDLSIGQPDPIDLNLHVGIALQLDDEGFIDATVDDVSYDLASIPNPLSNCPIASVFDALMAPELSPDLITDLLGTLLDPELEGLGATLETPLEEALAFLPLSTGLDLLGTTLDIELAPSVLWLDEQGLFLGLSATFDAPWDPTCVSDGVDDAGEPLPPPAPVARSTSWPPYGTTAWGDGVVPYDAALLFSADLVDQAAFVAWQAGLLCVDVSELSPVPIGTGLLGAWYGEDFEGLFPEEQPAGLILSADAAPKADFGGDSLLGLQLPGLHLDTVAELTYRQSRICRTDIDGSALLDVTLADGTLALGLVVDPTTWAFSEPGHELLSPGYSEGLAAGLPSLLSAFLGPDLLPAFPLPAFRGIGVGGLEVVPSSDGDWQGMFLTLDVSNPEPIVIEGCDGGCDGGGDGLDLEGALGCDEEGAGCDSGEGCDAGCEGGGCSTPGRGSGRVMLIVLTILTLLRRRR